MEKTNSSTVVDQDNLSASSDNYLDTSYQKLLLMISVIGALCVSVLLIYSFAIYKLWNWYIAGFFQLPRVPMSFALGVVLIGTLVIQGCKISFQKQVDEKRPVDLIFD